MSEQITSSSNSKIKHLKKLVNKKERDEFQEFVLENPISIIDAGLAGFWPKELYLTTEWLKKADKTGLKTILAKLTKLNNNKLEARQAKNTVKKIEPNNFFIIDHKVNKAFSSLTTPTGLAGLYSQAPSQLDLTQSCLYLNEIGDPGNLGTILRTALAFDFKQVVLDAKCADPYGPKALGASKEAIFKLNLIIDKDGHIFKKLAKSFTIYATSPQGQVKLDKVKITKPMAVVLGNEGHGINPAILKQADQIIKIDHSSQMESLNVAVFAGILLHQFWNRKNS